MILSIANLIADNDAIVVAQRTQDTVRYIQSEWNKSHAEPIDEGELRLFLCDERYGDLTEDKRVSSVCAVMRCARPTALRCSA